MSFIVLAVLSGIAVQDRQPEVPLLKEHGIGSDSASLIAYFRKQTLTPEKKAAIERSIRQLGHPRFAVREKAMRDLIEQGAPARSLLKAACNDSDPEIARRSAQCLDLINRESYAELTIAAIDQLTKLAPAEAIPVLLDYLPSATDEWVIDELFKALVPLASHSDYPTPKLLDAVKDSHPLRRAAAGLVLACQADPEHRKIARQLLTDPEAVVRFRTAEGLIHAGERDAVLTMIDCLDEEEASIRAQADLWLWRIDAEDIPAFPGSDTEDDRKAYQQAWKEWWEKNGAGVDLAKLVTAQTRLKGFTLGIEFNTNRVWEADPNGKLRWEIDASGPMDAQVLPGQRVLIAESGNDRVTERDMQGNILWEMKVDGEPINCERLPGGKTFIGTRNRVFLVGRSKKILANYLMSPTYLHAIRRASNGHYLGITSGGEVFHLDSTGNKVNEFKVTANSDRWGDVDLIAPGRYLVTNYGAGFLRAVDAEGNTIWQIDKPGICGVKRLPGGRFLLACPGKAMIVTRDGRTLREIPGKGSVRRAHQR